MRIHILPSCHWIEMRIDCLHGVYPNKIMPLLFVRHAKCHVCALDTGFVPFGSVGLNRWKYAVTAHIEGNRFDIETLAHYPQALSTYSRLSHLHLHQTTHTHTSIRWFVEVKPQITPHMCLIHFFSLIPWLTNQMISGLLCVFAVKIEVRRTINTIPPLAIEPKYSACVCHRKFSFNRCMKYSIVCGVDVLIDANRKCVHAWPNDMLWWFPSWKHAISINKDNTSTKHKLNKHIGWTRSIYIHVFLSRCVRLKMFFADAEWCAMRVPMWFFLKRTHLKIALMEIYVHIYLSNDGCACAASLAVWW